LVFGFQNKAKFLRGRFAVLDALLNCTYCLGFHTGWMSWIVFLTWERPAISNAWFLAGGAFVWAFVSSASCYLVDTAARWLEYRLK
jgi:hypothetical protein